LLKFMLFRSVCVGAAFAAAAAAQPSPDALSASQKTMETRTQEWKTLSAGMEDKLARLLPCDPKARAGIDEVSRASALRLGAVAAYLQLALDRASSDTRNAKQALAAEEARVKEAASDQADANQERAGVEGQTTDLGESLKRRASLREAQGVLGQAAGDIRQRAAVAQREADSAADLAASVKALVTAYEAREDAIKEEQAAFQTERTRWNAYYAARSSRTQIECGIIDPNAAKPAPQRQPAARRKKK
jgi:hypothetical protein